MTHSAEWSRLACPRASRSQTPLERGRRRNAASPPIFLMESLIEQRAEDAAAEGLWDDAEAHWRILLQTETQNVRALLGLASVVMRRAAFAEALDLLERARTAAPE